MIFRFGLFNVKSLYLKKKQKVSKQQQEHTSCPFFESKGAKNREIACGTVTPSIHSYVSSLYEWVFWRKYFRGRKVPFISFVKLKTPLCQRKSEDPRESYYSASSLKVTKNNDQFVKLSLIHI